MPMGKGGSGVVGSPLPKWQLALAVGALGLGYIYYRNTARSKRDSGKGSGKANGTTGDKQISIDGENSLKTNETSLPQTPTEQAQEYKNLGNAVFKGGKYDEAIAYYNQAIETCPKENKSDLATFYQNRAAAYEQLKKYSAVKDDCTKALELKPQYAKALLRRARAMEQMNELESVLEDVTAACILERFSNQSTLQMADRVLKQLGKQHAEEYLEKKIPVIPSKHFIKTFFHSFRRDPFALDETETSNPDNDEIERLNKAKRAMNEERYDDVIAICGEEIERFGTEDTPIKMQLCLLRATFNIFLGLYDVAMTDLKTVIDNEKSSKAVKVNALLNRASLHFQQDNHEGCFEDYNTAVKIDADCSDIYHHRAQMNLILDKIDEATKDSEKSLSLDPDFAVGYAQKCYIDYRYAVTMRSSKEIYQSTINFEKAIKQFPDCADCYTLYAQILADRREYDEADKYFAKALVKEPYNATVLVHRGLLQLQWHGDVEKAVDLIQKALEVDDRSGFAYETLGTIEVQRGKLQEAIDLFDKALVYGRSSTELTHIFSLQDAAKAQLKVSERYSTEGMTWLPQGM